MDWPRPAHFHPKITTWPKTFIEKIYVIGCDWFRRLGLGLKSSSKLNKNVTVVEVSGVFIGLNWPIFEVFGGV